MECHGYGGNDFCRSLDTASVAGEKQRKLGRDSEMSDVDCGEVVWLILVDFRLVWILVPGEKFCKLYNIYYNYYILISNYTCTHSKTGALSSKETIICASACKRYNQWKILREAIQMYYCIKWKGKEQEDISEDHNSSP